MLHEFLTANTAEIIARTRAKVAARTNPVPTEAELKNGVPLFLGQLIERMRPSPVDRGELEESATLHGGELLALGFTVSQVVHGYGDVCQVITQLADETGAAITAEEFSQFNRGIDDAIAHSVTEYQRRRDASIAYQGAEHLGMFAHELRNRLNTATLAFTLLQEGTVGIGGATGAMLGRSLRALRDLVNNSLAGVRLESGIAQRRRVSVAELIGEAEVEAAIAASRGVALVVAPVAPNVDVEADQQILSAAIGNLLQNAFKFSRPSTRVSLRTLVTADRVVIEIEDACGGLPPGKSEDLFRSFEQRGEERTGLGLGLAISRKGVEAMGGVLLVRNLPGEGCVFSIDLPRLPPR